jgi:hypothetical protein
MSISSKPSYENELYERDYYSWAEAQARALRDRRPNELDWENLAEEVDDLARRNADALEGQCETLIEHLLKVSIAPAPIRKNNLRLWRASIRNARYKIRTLLRRNPSLKARTDELFENAWPIGRTNALAKLDLDDDAVPEALLFSFNQAIDEGFAPSTLREPDGTKL